MAEDQDIVADEVDEHGAHAGDHRDDRLPGLPDRGRECLRHREHRQAGKHDHHVLSGIGHRRRHVRRAVRFAVHVQADQPVPEHGHDQDAEAGHENSDHDLEMETVAHALAVLFPVKLGTENTGRVIRAEYRKLEDHKQLVGYRDTAHLQGADPADHDVVKHVHECRDPLLDHDRYDDSHYSFVKRQITDIFVFPHRSSSVT